MTATGASIVLKPEDATVLGALARVDAAGGNLAPMMADIAAYGLMSTQRRFETKTAPGGTAWARLAPRTARERVKRGYGTENILRRKGLLYASLSARSDASAAVWGSNSVYAAVHNFGGEITQYAHSQMAYRNVTKTTTKTSDGETKPLYEIDWRFRSRRHSNFATWSTMPERTITIPARAFVGLDATDNAAILDLLGDHFSPAIGGER